MLVANAVDGLKPENVTIVNQDGQILFPARRLARAVTAASDSADALKMTQEQLLAKERYESALQQSIQSMLDDTLGPKRAVARVSTKMDFDANSTESKVYAPQGTVLSQQIRARIVQRNAAGAQPRPIGVPGNDQQHRHLSGAAQPTANGRYNRSKSTTNYDITEQNIKHIDAPGKVLQTSVAVLVDCRRPAATANGRAATAAAQTYQFTPANVQQIRKPSLPPPASISRRAIKCRSKRFRSTRRLKTPVRRRRQRRRSSACRSGRLSPSAACRARRRRPLAIALAPLARSLPSHRTAVLRHLARRRTAAIRRASDPRRCAGHRRADTFRSRSHSRADDRIRYDRRSREPRQHRQTRQTVAGGMKP